MIWLGKIPYELALWFFQIPITILMLYGNTFSCLFWSFLLHWIQSAVLSFVIVQSLSRVWLWGHGLQQARLLCLLPSPGYCLNSCPSSRWCHPTNSTSVVPFSSCPQPLPASESFPMSQLVAWGGQSTGVSALASFLPKKSQGWSPSEWTGWISLQSMGLSRVFSSTTIWKHQFFVTQPSLWSNSRIHTWLLEKPYLWPYGPL